MDTSPDATREFITSGAFEKAATSFMKARCRSSQVSHSQTQQYLPSSLQPPETQVTHNESYLRRLAQQLNHSSCES